MRRHDIQLSEQIGQGLVSFREIYPLPGIADQENFACFLEQLVDSVRRIRYVRIFRDRQISNVFIDNQHGLFHPRKAAIWHHENGDQEEAFWLVFLSVHFGKNLRTKYQLVSDIYHALGEVPYWTWERVSNDPEEFRGWLQRHQNEIRGHFGNHRKYQSNKATSRTGTAAAIESYVDWINSFGDHATMALRARQFAGNSRVRFDYLYNSMKAVISFGRTARFDYLTMLGKLDFIELEPGSTYMTEATGPLQGARLLFGAVGNRQRTPRELDELLVQLERHLGLYFGMQVLEDALCNWQKSPNLYERFNG